jgi:nucleotide-binding universal stress UspA family protein
MSYRSIVVHLDCGKRRSERLDIAVRFAEEFDANLVGLFALDLYAGMPPVADAGSILVEAELKRREVCLGEALDEFTRKTARRATKVQWLSSDEDAAREIALAARFADLIVIGQTDPDTFTEDGISASFAANVVFTAGKPVLLVPSAGHFEAVGRHALVAWNAAREAGRALTDSLPVLERSAVVDVVSFAESTQPDDPDATARAAVKTYLQDHGINATVRRYPAELLSPGELILSHAFQDAVDCIVMGAHGHTRQNEKMLGNATGTVMRATTIPVLLSR